MMARVTRSHGCMHISPQIRLILASASPRRAKLLRLTGWAFEAVATDIDEAPLPDEPAEEQALRLAGEKAMSAWRREVEPGIVVAADTLVVFDGQVLGKPKDNAEARRMLRHLRGRAHRVVTGLAVLGPGLDEPLTELCESAVEMRIYSDDEMDAYLGGGSPRDKAGAYGIQDREFDPVVPNTFRDCFANVMGLPLCHLVRAMRRMNQPAPLDVPTACQQHLSYVCPVYEEILT